MTTELAINKFITPKPHKEARWKITIRYLTMADIIEDVLYLDEIMNLHELVEQGPDWNCIVDINIVLNNRSYLSTINNNVLKECTDCCNGYK